MKKIEKNKLVYFVFPHINVPHCFTTKYGGVSTGAAAHMNVDSGKEPSENVYKNFDIIGEALGFDPMSITGLTQTHTARVEIVDKNNIGNKIHKPDMFGGCDGMVTNDPSLTLITMHADCLPLYFYDSEARVIGLAHAGWRGTVGGIAGVTIEKMKKLGSKNIKAGIGPGIGFCCFQVDFAVVEEFKKNLSFSDEYIKKDDSTNEPDKYKIDLVGINKHIMIEHGISESNIIAKEICTKCNHNLFHSHRVTGKERGNMGAFIKLKETLI